MNMCKNDVDKPMMETKSIMAREKESTPYPRRRFKLMCIFLNLRNKICNPVNKVKKAGVKSGNVVLDYACGPGGHAIGASKVIGDAGVVYAADIHPLSAELIKKKVKRKNISNIETITTAKDTGIGKGCVDVVMCFDAFHHFPDKDAILGEFHRVLKDSGILCMDDHHLQVEELVDLVEATGLFKHTSTAGKTPRFEKVIV